MFTVANHDNIRSDSNVRIGSILFRKIAWNIVHGKNIDSFGGEFLTLERARVQCYIKLLYA